MKQTTRAVLVNDAGLCFLALHNHYLPENIGKWGTVGGVLDESDDSLKSGLQRELCEEFKNVNPNDFQIGDLLMNIQANNCEHHFFEVRTSLRYLEIAQAEEVLEASFMSLHQVEALGQKDKLYFKIESELFRRVLSLN